MPRMDGSGPTGMGPSGRRMGPCSGQVPVDSNFDQFGFGLGMGRRRGWGGRGRGGFFQPFPVSEAQDKNFLEQRKSWLQSQIEWINKILSSEKSE
jgi:hypothetical protein